MDLGFSEAQEAFREELQAFMAAECDRRLVRDLEESDLGYSPDMWRAMAGRGWLGLIFPEAYGGGGRSWTDLVVLMEEIGRQPCPVPYQTGVLQSGLALLELGTEAQKAECLPRILDGGLQFRFCLTEPSGSYDAGGVEVRALPRGEDWSLNGTKLFIQYGASADYYLVAARTRDSEDPADGVSLFVVDAASPGIGLTSLVTMAEDKQTEIVFNQTMVPGTRLVGPLHGAWPALRKVLDLSTVALCAEMSGGMQAALDYAVEYSKIRIQFGRPIGSFQAIQHHAANMLIEMDAARYSAYEAAWRVDEGLPYEMETSMAKALCTEAYQNVTATGHQILGGVGFYKELDMQLWYRRAKSAEAFFGDAEYHRERIAQLMGL